jgi:hypothetical protein
MKLFFYHYLLYIVYNLIGCDADMSELWTLPFKSQNVHGLFFAIPFDAPTYLATEA